MGERVLRWGVDAVIGAGLLALVTFALCLHGAPGQAGEAGENVPREIFARWVAQFSGVASLSREETDENLRLELRALEARLDEMETRLLSGLSTVQLWRELAERHRNVSQIACENADEHLREMAAGQKRDRQRRMNARKDKARAESEGRAGK